MSESSGCCRCCFRFIFTLGLTSLFLWLSLRTANPKCSIERFYVPALNSSLNSSSSSSNNNTVFFLLKLENPNKDKGIYYDEVNVTVFDAQTRSRRLGSSVIPRFYQGHKKTAKKNGSFEAVSNGTAVFRVDLETAVRFKIMRWKTKRHRIRVGGDVRVNNQGSKEHKKNIKLKSWAPNEKIKKMNCFAVVVGISMMFFFV